MLIIVRAIIEAINVNRVKKPETIQSFSPRIQFSAMTDMMVMGMLITDTKRSAAAKFKIKYLSF